MGNGDHAKSDRMEKRENDGDRKKSLNLTAAFSIGEPSASFRTIAVAEISLLPEDEAIVPVMETLCQPIRKDPVVILHHQLHNLVFGRIVGLHELPDAICRMAAVVRLALVPYPGPDFLWVMEFFPASHVPQIAIPDNRGFEALDYFSGFGLFFLLLLLR